MYQLEKVRKKYTFIRNFLIQNLTLIRNKFNLILNFFHINECIFLHFNSETKVYAEILYKCRILSNFESREEVDLKELIEDKDIKSDLSRFAYKCHRLNQLFNFIYILMKDPNPDKWYFFYILMGEFWIIDLTKNLIWTRLLKLPKIPY